MKLSAWAKILVHPPEVGSSETAALYARVSSGDQKPDLERQLGRLTTFATSQGMAVVKSVSEVGSGLNGHRPKLMKLLADRDVQVVVVAHRDRLARFGSEYIEATLAASGRKLVVVDAGKRKDDLVQDMIDVLTSFCARLYGRRSATHRALKAVAATQEEPS